MFRHLTSSRTSRSRLLLAICLGAWLVLLALSSFRRTAPQAAVSGGNSLAPEARHQMADKKASAGPTSVPRQMVGEAARTYLQQPGEGQSLMQAITAARFGLKSQEHGPFGEAGAGQLG